MKAIKKVRIKRSLDQIQMDANKHQRRSDFAKYNSASYKAAKKRPDFEEICAHMVPSLTKSLTLEQIQIEAKKYKKRSNFEKGSNSAYQAACKRNDYEEIVAHMDPSITEAYSLEEIQIEANKYQKRGDLKEGNSAIYNAAKKRLDFEEICAHMDKPSNIAHTLDEIKQKVGLCKTRGEIYQRFPSIYQIIHKRSDYEEIVADIKKPFGPSLSEAFLLEKIKEYWPKAQKMRDRKVSIAGKTHIHSFEIDIYVPELRKGIEFDGRYYHTFEGLKRGRPNWPDEDLRNYHQLKDDWFASKDIQIMHIDWKDWSSDKEACVKRCLNFLDSN